jgi:hypothetical protein
MIEEKKEEYPVAQPPAAWLGQRRAGAAATLQALVARQGEEEASVV